MAKIFKSRLREDEPIVEETVAQEPAVPASQDEVNSAQSVDEAPSVESTVSEGNIPSDTQTESSPVEYPETPVTGDGDSEKSGIKVNPETVSLQMNIPTDQLAAAVAQVTGDVKVAEAAPDAVAEQISQSPDNEPLVSEGGTQEGVEATDTEGEGLVSDEEVSSGTDAQPSQDTIVESLKKKKSLKESKEEEEAEEEAKEEKTEEPEGKLNFDDIDATAEDGNDPDLPEGFSDDSGLEDGGMDMGIFDDIDHEESSFNELSGKLDDIFGSSEEIAQVADTLRTSAKVMDILSDEKQEEEVSEPEYTEDEEDDGSDEDTDEDTEDIDNEEEPLDFDRISDFNYDSDYSEDDDEDDDEPQDEEYMEESLERVPCRMPVRRESLMNHSMRARGYSRMKEYSNEGIIWPAGSEPSYRGTEEPLVHERDTMVEAHERTVSARRKAIEKFRESIKRENAVRNDNRRFREALESSVRIHGRRNSDSGSWDNNRFLDRYEESQKLDFNRLMEDGFLG